MILASFDKCVEAAGWILSPGVRYVMSQSMFNRIVAGLAKTVTTDPVVSWSCFNSYERRYGGQDLNGRRLAIYRENAFGDNLIVTGLTRYLKNEYPECEIHVYAMPRVREVWRYNEDVMFVDAPMGFDAARRLYDYHCFFEGMMENDTEPDQANCYDAMFSFAGIYPKSVPDDFKRPHITLGPDDKLWSDEWRNVKPWRYVLWHWNPSVPTRQYAPALSREAILLLAEHIDVCVIGHTEGTEALELDHPKVHDFLGKTPNIRAMLPMIQGASCVVAPDSGVLHLTAAFPIVPLVGLWGSFDSNDRARYYHNHTPIAAYSACPSSPCRAQKEVLPRHLCQQAAGYVPESPYCTAISAIAPERIVETVLTKV